MKKCSFIVLFCLLGILMWSCGNKKDGQNDIVENTENPEVNAFSAEALPEIVEYQRQKSSNEGTGEYNPWEMYGLKEMVGGDNIEDVTDEDYEYGDDIDSEEEERQFEEASDGYDSEPVVYYLGHNVDFKLNKNDISDFKKKGDDAVAVIDRLDNNAKQIDILVYDKALYDDFVKKSKDQVRFEKIGDNLYVSKGDSSQVDVALNFVGPSNGGYLLNIYNK